MGTGAFTATDANTPNWLGKKRGKNHLLASREISSGRLFFPPIKPSSPLTARYELAPLSAVATLYSFTIIHPKAGKPPFVLVNADFAEQVRVFGIMELAPGTLPHIGQRLAVEFRVDEYGAVRYMFTAASKQ